MKRQVIFSFKIILLMFSLAGCLESKPKFKVGDCLNPVDGSEFWKLTSIEKKQLKGIPFKQGTWGKNAETLPDRIFVEVPCPIKK